MRTLLITGIIALSFSALPGLKAGDSWTTAVDRNPGDSLPVPEGVRHLLFYIQRSTNPNTIIYALNYTPQGTLNEEDPVQVFWLRYAEDGERKELNYIQRKFAYGLKVRRLGNDGYALQFVSYSKLPLYLQQATEGGYHVYTEIAQQQARLERIFVNIDGGSFWLPNITFVELSGTAVATGEKLISRFRP